MMNTKLPVVIDEAGRSLWCTWEFIKRLDELSERRVHDEFLILASKWSEREVDNRIMTAGCFGFSQLG
jgi:hypothetical protein